MIWAAAVDPWSWVVLMSTSSLSISRARSRSAAGGTGPAEAAQVLLAMPSASRMDAETIFDRMRKPGRGKTPIIARFGTRQLRPDGSGYTVRAGCNC